MDTVLLEASSRWQLYFSRQNNYQGTNPATTNNIVDDAPRTLYKLQFTEFNTVAVYRQTSIYVIFKQILKLLSKLIRILRITWCDRKLCGRCLVNMTPVVSGNTLRILHYYKRIRLAIIIVYKEQRACRSIVTSRMSTNAGNRRPLKRMNTTPYVRHIVPLLCTQSIKKHYSK